MDNGVHNTAEASVSAGAPPLSELIDKVLQNPELLTLVASALGGFQKGAKQTAPESAAAQQASAAAAAPAASQAPIESSAEEVPAAAEPEVHAGSTDLSALGDKLPEMVAALSPILSGLTKPAHHPPPPPGPKKPQDQKTALLCAIKPYLSRERGEAIDYIIKFGKLAEIFKGIY